MPKSWKCPKCSAPANGCGKGGQCRGGACLGLLCECPSGGGGSKHGTESDPCPNANCYHCEWGGVFPPPKFKLKGWAKTAWDAGWRPPAGWSPPTGK